MPTKIEKDAISGTETTGHEWDGVKELNTPLPKWWVYTFVATIGFAVVYGALYPSIPGLRSHSEGLLGYSNREALRESMSEATAQQAKFRERIRGASIEQVQSDPDLFNFALIGGRAAFNENCAACHKTGGAGGRGFPNLADDDWLWGGKLADIHQTITHGVRNPDPDSRQSQMPRFGVDGLLTPAQIDAVANHVLSLSEKSPPSAAGAKVFADNCAVCHGKDGEGDREVGAPSLRDQIWLYGGDKPSIVQSIVWSRSGSMPAWGQRLDETTIKMLTVYVHALGGGE
jgi:cytochrome c oxidase cbb3-type subunit 3